MFSIRNEYTFLNLRGAWHLCYYLPKNRPAGSLSDRILHFKNNSPFYVNAWSQWASDELIHTGIHFDYICRALGSQELQVVGNKALDGLGSRLAHSLGSMYIPTILSKNRVTPPMHTLHTLPERRAAINGSYDISDRTHNLNDSNILIIDDVTTTNVTISEILRVLRNEWRDGRYYLFCLGKTSYDDSGNDNINVRYFN